MNYRRFSLFAVLLGGLLFAGSASALTVAEVTDVVAKVDEPPVPVKITPPEYPRASLKQNVKGLVSLVLVIDERGEVIAAEISKASHDEFRDPALAAVRRWKFKAAKVGGKPVKVKVNIPVQFAIE